MRLAIFILALGAMPLVNAAGDYGSIWNFFASVTNLILGPRGDQPKFTVSGPILKSNASHEPDSSLSINWFNFMEGQKGLKDGTAWKRTGGVSRLNDSHFSVEMEMTEEHFLSNITTSPQILQRYKNLGLSNATIEQIENFSLAMGFIYGTGRNLRDIWINSGDAGEVNTWADMYAVFFKHGSVDEFTIPAREGGRAKTLFQDCHWYQQLPQGFSCGRGAPKDPSCGRGYFERFEQVSCSEVEVKVASSHCEHTRGEERVKDVLNPNPSCFMGINWT